MLRRAANFIDRGWIKGTFAENADGKRVHWSDKKACRFCAYGALMRAQDSTKTTNDGWNKACDTLLSLVPNRDIVQFNDSIAKTNKDVSDLFRKAANAD